MKRHYPQRVVCLTTETTEIAFALGCGERVEGVSGYAVRPADARTRPKVAAFSTAHGDRILALQPDLVLGFSDLQAAIVADLVKAGVQVLVTNQRDLAGTYQAIRMIAGVLGEAAAGERIVGEMERELAAVVAASATLPRRPRVFFEEWDTPLITGIGWVSEIIRLAGGEDIFPELAASQGASGRIVDGMAVVERNPDVIIASWCGKKANLARIRARDGWDGVTAIRAGEVHEVKSADILQPGPSLVLGARRIAGIIANAAQR